LCKQPKPKAARAAGWNLPQRAVSERLYLGEKLWMARELLQDVPRRTKSLLTVEGTTRQDAVAFADLLTFCTFILRSLAPLLSGRLACRSLQASPLNGLDRAVRSTHLRSRRSFHEAAIFTKRRS
jgi:hypothetical protein